MVQKVDGSYNANRRLRVACAVILACVFVVAGGSYTRTSFPLVFDGSADSNVIAVSGGIGLGVERRMVLKLSGDALSGTLQRGISSDIAAIGIDSFCIWYVDTSADRVVSQGLKVSPSGNVVTTAASQAAQVTATQDCYLHADQGDNGSCVSYVHKGTGNKRYLRVSNGTAVRHVDSSQSTGWLFPSQCAMAEDTFLTIVSVDMNRTTLRKIYSRGGVMSVSATATVAAGAATAGNSLMNCAVAADDAGNICAAVTRGSPGGVKRIEYQMYGRDFTPGPAGSLADPVADPDSFYYYDDAAITSYGIGRFALVTWDETGVSLHELALAGNSVQQTSRRVVSAGGVRFCAVDANANYLLIACIGDVDGNGVAGIEGLKYPISSGALGVPEIISYSDPLVPVQTVDHFSTAINCAIDDSGTFAITWRHQTRIALCVWSHRPIRYMRGFYTSPVESLAAIADSVEFNPAQVSMSSTASWFTEDSLRFGISPAACAAAPWISFTDANVLRDNRTNARYYQFRVSICRRMSGSIDSLTTPSLTAVTVPWNIQPRIVAVDSVAIGASVDRLAAFGDTVDVVARYDSVRCYLYGRDDDGGNVVMDLSLPSTPDGPQLGGGPDYRALMTVHPLQNAGIVAPCTLTIEDAANWRGVPRVLHLRTRNLLPRSSPALVTYDRRASGDTVIVNKDTAVVIQEEDSIDIVYSVADDNDGATVRGYVGRRTVDGETFLDSALPGALSVYRVRGDTATPTDTIRLSVAARDVDTTVAVNVGVLVNHRPRFLRVLRGVDTLHEGDTVNVALDDTTLFSAVAHDTDCAFGDTLFFRSHLVARPDSVSSAVARGDLHLVPAWGDTLVRFSVTDRFGRTDSLLLHLAYPWYETDSIANPGYVVARRALAAGPSLLDGNARGDTIVVPVLNSGHNRLLLTGATFSAPSSTWLSVEVDRTGAPFTVTAADDSFPHTVTVAPGASVELAFIMSAEALSGDSVLTDTIRIFTDDPKHPVDTLPLRLEYNDLPLVVSVSPDFIADRPYRSFSKRAAYRFPPHASIAIAFSEPMDSTSATAGVRLYSVPDMRVRGRFDPIPLSHEWSQNYTVLRVSPRYEAASPAFKVMPPAGLFIPTDSLLLVFSDTLVDRAATPSGPNALDVNRDNERGGADRDTVLGMRVDSIAFTVVSIDPAPGRIDVGRNVRIGITFSSPVYAASVDTSLERNRSLLVTSACNGGGPLRFSSVTAESARVFFTLAQELFYRDTLECRYSSRWIGDMLGFSADNNDDGIDATMFDSASRDDDLAWGYRIKTIRVASVNPDSETVVSEISPAVTVRFDDRLPPGVVDTDTSRANRSFRMGSARTGPTSFLSVVPSADGMSVTFRPKMVFFSDDSMYCKFTGFTTAYRYAVAVNLPADTVAVFGSLEWSFRSANVGFYTYPNPYKPGANPRHCASGGPCGIWFKNLHSLAVDLHEVAVAVFTMNAHPVFDTRTTGERIVFSPETGALPQWRWNTNNNHGVAVASGIYLYAVYNPAGAMLKRGKLIIVR